MYNNGYMYLPHGDTFPHGDTPHGDTLLNPQLNSLKRLFSTAQPAATRDRSAEGEAQMRDGARMKGIE